LGDCGQGGNGLIQVRLHLLHRLIAALQFLPQLLNLLLLAFQGPFLLTSSMARARALCRLMVT
jgi:hypothetical protein